MVEESCDTILSTPDVWLFVYSSTARNIVQEVCGNIPRVVLQVVLHTVCGNWMAAVCKLSSNLLSITSPSC